MEVHNRRTHIGTAVAKRHRVGCGVDRQRSSLWLTFKLACVLLPLTTSLHGALAAFSTTTAPTNVQPNILLILTDDQDLVLGGMTPMQRVQKILGEQGVTFTNAFTSSPLCCPSRASLLSGMYAHNHRTVNNSLSGGCNGERWSNKVEPNALPVVLQKDGDYETFYAGKYLNEYFGERLPHGWTHFYGLHGNSRYYNYTLRENAVNVSYTDTYLTDLLRDKALEFLQTRKDTRPFFAMIAPPAPHAPYTSAERHRREFPNVKAQRTPNFNHIPAPQEKHWLVAATRTLIPETIDKIDAYFQQRWQALLAVDEMVDAIVELLEQQQQLHNTYIIYTSDNGYHMGQFAQPWDKRQPYETDIRVPLLVRGPGIPVGVSIDTPALLLDLVPTVLEWTGLRARTELDGVSMRTYLAMGGEYESLKDKNFKRSLLVQHWGEGNIETYKDECPWAECDRLAQCTKLADCHCQDAWNNTYSCVRHFRKGINRLYCEFQDTENFVEAYDVTEDQFQMENIGYDLLPIEHAFYSLALENLTRCAGNSCNEINI